MKKPGIVCFVIFFILGSCNNSQEPDLNLRHLDHVAESMNNSLIDVKNDIINLQHVLSYKIPYEKNVNWISEDKYHNHPGEILFSTYTKGHSAIYHPAHQKITKRLQRVIVNTERLDSLLADAVKCNLSLSQVYFLDTSSFLRIYPYINVVNYLNSSVNLTKLISFEVAQHKPFISDHAYWVNKPFADPFGRGWVFSCVEPVYYRDRFIGIVAGDISLHTLKSQYFSSNTEIVLLIDEKGEIICATREASRLLNIPQYRDFQYFKPVTSNIYIFNTPSLLNHKNSGLRNAVNSLLSGKTKETFYIDKEKYTVYKSTIRETNWFLLKVIN